MPHKGSLGLVLLTAIMTLLVHWLLNLGSLNGFSDLCHGLVNSFRWLSWMGNPIKLEKGLCIAW